VREHRVLIGLSPEETAKFEALDLAPNETVRFASRICVSERAAATHEIRWLELHSKHEGAWRAWIVESQAERVQDSGFVNYG
jgi:hypothetical protein